MHVSVIGRLVGTATRVGAHPATRGGGLLQHRRKARSPSLAACGGLVLIAMMTGGVGLLSGVGPAGGVTWASAQESCDSWVGPVTGTVSGSIGSYWSMGVPAKGVPVCINKDGTYTVVMNNQPHAFVEVGELQIGAASGNPTLEVTGANGNVELRLDAGATVGGNGTHGTLALHTTASVDYLAEVTGAKGAALAVSSGGKLLVSGPLGSQAAATIAVPITNQAGGKVDIAGSTNMGMGEVTVVNSGTFDIAHGASVYVPQDSFTQSAGTLAVRGTLTLSGAASVFTLAGGSESGGPVKLVGGTTLVEGPGTMGFDITGNVYLRGDIPAAQTVTVDGSSTNSDVSLTGGTTVKGTLALDASAKGLADLDGAKGAALAVSSGGKLLVSGPLGSQAAATIAVPITNQAGGKVDIAGSTNMGMGEVTVVNSGTFDIAHGASVYVPQDSFTQSAGTLAVRGTLTLSGAASVFTLAGGSESGGPVKLVGGTTLVEGPGTMGFDITGNVYLRGDIPAAQTVTVDGSSTNSDVSLTGGTTVKGTLALDASAKGLADLDGAKGAALAVSSGGKLLVSGPLGSQAAATIAVPITNQAGGKVDIATDTGFADGTPTANSGAFDIVHGGQVVLSGGSTLTNEATGTLRVTVDANTKSVSGITGPGVALNGTLAVATMGSPAVGSSYVAIGGPVTGKFSAYSFGRQHYSVRYASGKASSKEVLLTFK